MSSIWTQSSVSTKRIQDFLLHDDIDDDNVKVIENGSEHAIEVKNGDFAWERDANTPFLKE